MKQADFASSSCSREWRKRLCRSPLFRSWWMLLALILGVTFYSHAIQKKEREYEVLKIRKEILLAERTHLLQEQEDLKMRINSQSDPAWIELVLMRGLGLVPEGQKKVYFKD